MTSSVSAPLASEAFDYPLPDRSIAQQPLERRDRSRLLHVRQDGGLEDHAFADLPSLLREGDLLVANETRVRAARVCGRREPEGGVAELLVLEQLSDVDFACLVRPARRLHAGSRVRIADELFAEVGEPALGHPGARRVRFVASDGSAADAIERHGVAPLPPYIVEPVADARRYQTVYAAGPPVSAAAPTAGLHLTSDVLSRLRDRGVGWATVRLEVGLGTFAPIRTEHIDDHVMHVERFELGEATAGAVDRARAVGGRVIALGTTAVRVLESCGLDGGTVAPQTGTTGLYMRPGYRPRVVDGLVTNFHQPRSSLLVLLAALIGQERWRRAYDHALASGYRFLSFGDAMLCWPVRS